MGSNNAMIERRQCPAPARPHSGPPNISRLAAYTEVDDWLRSGVAPPRAGELDLTEATRLPDSVTIRARRLLAARIKFIGHPSFDDALAVARILGPTPHPDGGEGSFVQEAPGEPRPPSAESETSRLLTREQEFHLFRKMNFLKYTAARMRAAIDPDAAISVEIDRVETLLREAAAILDRIIQSNLALAHVA
jgi:RNA polymerase primary sigma factor